MPYCAQETHHRDFAWRSAAVVHRDRDLAPAALQTSDSAEQNHYSADYALAEDPFGRCLSEAVDDEIANGPVSLVVVHLVDEKSADLTDYLPHYS